MFPRVTHPFFLFSPTVRRRGAGVGSPNRNLAAENFLPTPAYAATQEERARMDGRVDGWMARFTFPKPPLASGPQKRRTNPPSKRRR